MDYAVLKNWIVEISGLITAILIVCGFVKPMIEWVLNFTKTLINVMQICCCEFKKNIPFVWRKDYRSLANDLHILQNELKKKDNQLMVQEDSIRSLKTSNSALSKKLADFERTEWKDGILYCNGTEICSRCYDTSSSADRKKVRLLTSDHEIKGIFYCPECKTHHKTTEGALQQRDKHRAAVRLISGRGY